MIFLYWYHIISSRKTPISVPAMNNGRELYLHLKYITVRNMIHRSPP